MAAHPKRCCPVDTPPSSCPYAAEGDQYYISGSPSNGVGILIISDIYGILNPSKRLPDTLAKAGYLAVMPDFYEDRSWNIDKTAPDFDSAEWCRFFDFIKDMDAHRPKALRAIALMRQMGCKKIGCIGMCWGAQLCFDLAAKGLIDAAATAHPSFFNAKLVEDAKVPVCVLPSVDEKDFEPVEAAVNKHPIKPAVYSYYDKLHHGFFGARWDPTEFDDTAAKQHEDAMKHALDFFKEALH